jgi:hypothetical protein
MAMSDKTTRERDTARGPIDQMSVEQLERFIAEATGEVQRIEVQLASRNRTSQDGERLSAEAYWGWHERATYRKAAAIGEIRMAKLRLGHLRPDPRAEHEQAVEEALGQVVESIRAAGDMLAVLCDLTREILAVGSNAGVVSTRRTA